VERVVIKFQFSLMAALLEPPIRIAASKNKAISQKTPLPMLATPTPAMIARIQIARH